MISYLVVQRSRELAIRRAIGARTSHIFQVLGGSSLRLTMVGLVLGLGTGSLTAPLLGGLLVNVSPRDPVTLLGAAVVMLATAGLACVPPIVRAIRVDPLPALKAE